MSKLLVVFSATGSQGKSVINAVLNDSQLSKEYSIRGTTRDPSKADAQELAKRGVEIVSADINDPESLRKAFTGADTVYAYTVSIYEGGKAKEHEINHGRALVDAAIAAKVSRYIYSTLSHAGNISGGNLKYMGHFDGKAEVEDYIRTLPIRSAFVAPGCFMQNFNQGQAPRPAGEGVWAIAGPVSPDTKLPLIDTLGDIGKWVAAILADFEAHEGEVLFCATDLYTYQEVAEIMSKVTGKNVVYKQVPGDVWKGFLPEPMRHYIYDMLVFFQDYGYFGENTEEKVKSSATKARGHLSTFEEYLTANPLKI